MRMNEGLCVFALVLLVSAGSVTRAEAIPVVSLGGIPGSWNSGDSFSVDVIVTGLYQITTGVNLDVDFNTTLSGTGYAFGATAFINPLDGINGSDSSGGFAGGLVSLNWTSFHAHADLTGAQGPFPSEPLVLATVDFIATGTGTPEFALQSVQLFDGTALVPVCSEGTTCRVPVPEPGTVALFGAALAALGVRRFRRW
jgi:hypothetical protein